jgi:uncharacterized damage-inducible protein DinB
MSKATISGCLRRSVTGSPWHGYSLNTLLVDVTAAEATAHPIRGGHSIAEIVAHVAVWMDEVASWLTGAARSDRDWPAPAGWPQPLAELTAAHERLQAELTRCADARLSQRAEQATEPGLSFADVLVGVAEHNAYHGGQIGLLKRALRGPASARSS